MGRLYGKVESIEDIGRINCIIRDEMLKVDSVDQLSELKKRSDYLCTLTYSPFWIKKFKDQIQELRQTAVVENRISVKTANYVAKYKGFDKHYEVWKKEINIEEELSKIPQKTLDEINEYLFSKSGVEILESLRELFCDIRKSAVLCENVECLDRHKRAVDIISTLPYIESFVSHFDEGKNSAIDALINKEKERSVLLINIISEVNRWQRYYETVSEGDFKTDAEDFLQNLLKEEEKSDTYVPTEMKYKEGAKVLWIVYYHPQRKREYAKRVYIPQSAKNVKFEGPGEFKNRFGNRVWGIKITYESEVSPTVIHIRGKEIKLPKRTVTKSKVVTLPKTAQNIKITDQKPQSAMDIA